MKKNIGLFLVPLLVWIGCGSIYYIAKADFSLVDVNRPKNLDLFLKNFFSGVCVNAWQPDMHYVESISRGCSYHYVPPALVVGYSILYMAGDSGNEFRFSFDSYSNRVLKVKYVVGPLFPSPLGFDERQESGVMTMDLSRYENPGDDILVQFLPHIPLGGHLVKSINEQPPFDEISRKKRSGWGTTLVYKLLSLVDPERGSSTMTFGREQAYFLTTSYNKLYLDLRAYFESGSMKHFGYSDFLYFSAAILTSSALGDMAPVSFWMKILVSLESLFGIIWLGVVAGWALENWGKGLKLPLRRGSTYKPQSSLLWHGHHITGKQRHPKHLGKI
ncbi:potassium channel family protein [Bdellovibrio sp. HCB337]|uniref:potassium channel family protein n=1 Tax=Bdellovibrio sp. HCB337 TaxID=3394358 RepID=UPI0039A46E26